MTEQRDDVMIKGFGDIMTIDLNTFYPLTKRKFCYNLSDISVST